MKDRPSADISPHASLVSIPARDAYRRGACLLNTFVMLSHSAASYI